MTLDRTARSFGFGPFVLLPERQQLLRRDRSVRIGARALEMLTALVERPGELVTKTELMARVWPDTKVEESNLKVNMAALRRALGEPRGAPVYIATVVGHGYRFVAPVVSSSVTETNSSVARETTPPLHNLPASSTLVIGRADTIAAVRRDLSESRLVSIVGTGGVGKTTVAVAVAEGSLTLFGSGTWFVDLAPFDDSALVPSAIAAAVGMTAHSSNMLAALCEYLRGRDVLLVLDSCERVIDGVAACVDRLLSSAPRVKILASTREPLLVKGERVRRLAGLDAPPESADLTARDALSFSAVELFVTRAAERVDSFELSDADAPSVASICRRLDGLALAIEIAATRVDSFGMSALLAQLEDRIEVLSGNPSSTDRHRTLAWTLDWSYDLLSERERAVMRRLGAFAGAFSLTSACAVASADANDRLVVEDLANLVAKSLVATDLAAHDVEYRLLDTTRAYALEKLSAEGEVGVTRLRHAEHVLALAVRARTDLEGLSRSEWLRRYATKLDELRLAIRWASASESHHALAVELTVAALPFWKQLSLLEECRVAVERALEPRFAPHRTPHHDLVLNIALGTTLLHTRGPMLHVRASLSRALEIAEALGDTELQVACLRPLAEYNLWTGESRAALAVADKLRAIGALGHEAASGDADAQAGSALRWIGDLEGSRRHLEKVVVRPLREVALSDAGRFELDQRLVALGSLAQVLWLQGFPDRAVEMARRQREEAAESHYAASICSALVQTIAVSLFVCDLDATERYLDALERHSTEHRMPVWKAMATCHRGRWLVDSGKPVDLAAFRSALSELHESGFRMRYPAYLAHFGMGQAQHGDFDGAIASVDEVMALCRSYGHSWGIPEALRMKGTFLRSRGGLGDTEAATDCFMQSIAMAREQGALSWELRTITSLVELHRAAGGNAEAETMLATAYARFTEGLDTGDLRRARSLLDTAR